MEEQPELKSRTQPANEDLGDLSSIFADGSGAGGNEEPGDTGNPIIGPTVGSEDWGEKKKDKKGGIVTKWWFWTGIAVGAGLLGGGSYLLYDQLGSGGGSSGYSANVYWDAMR